MKKVGWMGVEGRKGCTHSMKLRRVGGGGGGGGLHIYMHTSDTRVTGALAVTNRLRLNSFQILDPELAGLKG